MSQYWSGIEMSYRDCEEAIFQRYGWICLFTKDRASWIVEMCLNWIGIEMSWLDCGEAVF